MKLVSTVVLLILRWSLVHSAPELTVRRVGNELTLSCRDNLHIALANAEFWLNSTRLTDLLLPGSYGLDIGKIDFTINPDLEGYFYCDSDTTSRSINTLELTGKLIEYCMYCL